MSNESLDDSLFKIQAQLVETAVSEVNRLRRLNRDLRKTIAEFPSTTSELQDRVSMLEQLLKGTP